MHHLVVVVRVVADVAGEMVFLQAADAVLQPGRAGLRPFARERFGVASVRHEVRVLVVHAVGKVRLDGRHRVEIRDAPRFGTVGEVAVGEHDDRRAVRDGDPACLECGVEAVGG